MALSIEEDLDAVKNFSKKVDMKYPTFVAEADLQEAYEVQYIPFVIFIDKTGQERYREVGYSEEGAVEFEKLIAKLLEEGG